MIRKLLICPWFGPLPEWMPAWERNVASLERYGYSVLRVHDLEWFKQRVRDTLDIEAPIVAGEGKIHDYRCAFGVIFAAELRHFDFWGHTDFDCVYGRIPFFVPESALGEIDLFSNHPTYVSGPWSIYRNRPVLNELFTTVPGWRDILEIERTTGWVETVFSEAVDAAHDAGVITKEYANFQTRNAHDFSTVHFDGDRLLEGEREIMVAHFRHTKVYPEGCR